MCEITWVCQQCEIHMWKCFLSFSYLIMDAIGQIFLPLSKLWKKALSPLAELQICTEKSLPIFQSRAMRCFCSYVNSDVCVCREKTLCWNANHGSCLQGGVFSPSLSRSSDTTSHLSSLNREPVILFIPALVYQMATRGRFHTCSWLIFSSYGNEHTNAYDWRTTEYHHKP